MHPYGPYPLYSEQRLLRIFDRTSIGFIAFIVCIHRPQPQPQEHVGTIMGIFSNINSLLYLYTYILSHEA
jgi:hypothetical protein